MYLCGGDDTRGHDECFGSQMPVYPDDVLDDGPHGVIFCSVLVLFPDWREMDPQLYIPTVSASKEHHCGVTDLPLK